MTAVEHWAGAAGSKATAPAAPDHESRCVSRQRSSGLPDLWYTLRDVEQKGDELVLRLVPERFCGGDPNPVVVIRMLDTVRLDQAIAVLGTLRKTFVVEMEARATCLVLRSDYDEQGAVIEARSVTQSFAPYSRADLLVLAETLAVALEDWQNDSVRLRSCLNELTACLLDLLRSAETRIRLTRRVAVVAEAQIDILQRVLARVAGVTRRWNVKPLEKSHVRQT